MQAGTILLSGIINYMHERYPLGDRLRIVGRNPEWVELANQKHMPEVTKPPTLAHNPEEGIIYPLETGQPDKSPRSLHIDKK